MIQGVRDINYNVFNVKKAIAFYTQALQMKLQHQDEYWVSLDCVGVNIGRGHMLVFEDLDGHVLKLMKPKY